MMREVCSIEALKAVAALAPEPEGISHRRQTTPYNGPERRLLVEDYLSDNGIGYELKSGKGHRKFILDECPFDSDHKAPDSMVTQGDDGALGFKCFHNGCANNRWQDFKALIGEPAPENWDPPKLPKVDPRAEFGTAVDTSPLNPAFKGVDVDTQGNEKQKSDDFTPFPLKALPSVLRNLAVEAAESIGCDPSFVVMPVLSVCAAAIGTSRNLMLKRGWFAPSILWTVVLGESGSQKSPAFRLAVEPLKERQKEYTEAFAAEHAGYMEDLSKHKDEMKRWEKSKTGDRPEQPSAPAHGRCVVSDSTIEALAPILMDNDRGVLLARDELSGWIAGFDRYAGKGSMSSEVQKWLEIYNCESITIDRKTGDVRYLFVPRPSVCICGGIQPSILSQCMTDEHKANGLQSRLLMAYPPRRPKQWREDEVSDQTVEQYHQTITNLFTLKPSVDASGKVNPTVLRLDSDAKALFRSFVDSHGAEQNAMQGHLASQWSKLEEVPGRLSIVIHCIRQDTTGVSDAFSVDAKTMTSAIRITEWFKTETLRINQLLTEPEEVREARHLADWIKSKGGEVTARDLCRGRRDIQSTELAELKLIDLVGKGFGEWNSNSRTRHFSLFIS